MKEMNIETSQRIQLMKEQFDKLRGEHTAQLKKFADEKLKKYRAENPAKKDEEAEYDPT